MIQYLIEQTARWVINNQLLVKGTCKRDVRNKLFSIGFVVCWIKCCIVVRSSGIVTDGRTDRAAFIAAPLLCIHSLKALTDSANLWMPNQLLCSQQSRNVQTPSRNISSNCLTRFVNMNWLFHNQGENSSEGQRLGLVLSSRLPSWTKNVFFWDHHAVYICFPCNL